MGHVGNPDRFPKSDDGEAIDDVAKSVLYRMPTCGRTRLSEECRQSAGCGSALARSTRGNERPASRRPGRTLATVRRSLSQRTGMVVPVQLGHRRAIHARSVHSSRCRDRTRRIPECWRDQAEDRLQRGLPVDGPRTVVAAAGRQTTGDDQRARG